MPKHDAKKKNDGKTYGKMMPKKLDDEKNTHKKYYATESRSPMQMEKSDFQMHAHLTYFDTSCIF